MTLFPHAGAKSFSACALAVCILSCVCPFRTVNFPSLTVTADELSFHTQQIAMARGIPLGEVSRQTIH